MEQIYSRLNIVDFVMVFVWEEKFLFDSVCAAVIKSGNSRSDVNFVFITSLFFSYRWIFDERIKKLLDSLLLRIFVLH